MQITTVLYIVLAGVAAIAIAWFQYRDKIKGIRDKQVLFAFLRFCTLFLILLLLINPKHIRKTFFLEKTPLSVLMDNSSSILRLSDSNVVKRLRKELEDNPELQQKYDLRFFKFDAALGEADSLTFDKKQTNITRALQQLKNVQDLGNAPLILMSDGNQTLGADYTYYNDASGKPIYPVVLGDTTTYADLRLDRINMNRYAFLKNKYPLEIFAVYDGKGTVNTTLQIKSGGKILFSQPLSFSENQNSQSIQTTLEAEKTGVQSLSIELIPIPEERNTENNRIRSAIEVIDQKTSVALVSDLLHPDIGMLIKSIEANEQRSVTVFKSSDAALLKEDFDLMILYQPSRNFKPLFDRIATGKLNAMIVAGTKTDWNFLNTIQQSFYKESGYGVEDVLPVYNDQYSTFITEDIGFDEYPPLKVSFGEVQILAPHDILLYQKIQNIVTELPLIATYTEEEQRKAVFFGEDLWRWRAQDYLLHQDFSRFDTFLGKIIQYLTSDNRKERLNLYYDSFYYGNEDVVIRAEFFDSNYIFDDKANLEILVKGETSGISRTFPLLLKNNEYEVNLSSLAPDAYSFTVKVANEGISKSGNFTILEFDVEGQFHRANLEKMEKLAQNTGGEVYMPNALADLIESLIADERYKPIQKQTNEVTPLIDWQWILFLIILSLSLEWFLRKYHGLI